MKSFEVNDYDELDNVLQINFTVLTETLIL